MTDNELINAVGDEICAKANAGEDIPSLLRHVQHLVGRKDSKLLTVMCFHKTFGAGIASLSPLAGWNGFGGELTDAGVVSLVGPVLEDYRARAKGGVANVPG
jgi:hypothetical protein